MATRRSIVGLAVTSTWIALGLLLGPKQLPAYNPVASPAPGEKAATAIGLKGAGSCSGRGCHGNTAPDAAGDGGSKTWQHAYVISVTRDRHANAYQILGDDPSKQIAKSLNEKDPQTGKVLEAHENKRCLACHATPQAVDHQDEVPGVLADGVGCESCHGAAKDWIGPHANKDWKGLSVKEKRDKGFIPLSDLATRAQTCAGCHVGAPATAQAPVRDMNHDLIAAGHPRLNFEFSAFQANMPHHWGAKDKPAAEWAVGEAAVAKGALDLLADRAARAGDNKAPWPEFSEYDCFACHHDLQGKSWRQTRGYKGRKPGSLPWGTWYSSMPRLLAGPDLANTPDAVSPLNELERLMQQPYPDPAAVGTAAKKAAAGMGELLAKLEKANFDPKTVAKAYLSELKGNRAATKEEWDAVAQLYLSLAALNQAKPDKDTDGVLKLLLEKLQFPGEKQGKLESASPRGQEYSGDELMTILKPLSP